ncbi:HigA family addiction module antitoxin [Aureimonas psammosilenae]|uniref:HigA family addiction module antitoxin n=1 Tax=Aureimonas psammosilenae TaxID=2495496 RepID=UPI001260DEDD|nr:HigA family addiction module antitoxin [Aureimonas psammosilenae]
MLTFARPIHPGEYLREEYLVPLGLSAGALARHLNLPRTRIERIVKEEVGLSSDTALRLARYFRTTPQFWMNFQQAFDLETGARALAKELEAIKPRETEQAAA